MQKSSLLNINWFSDILKRKLDLENAENKREYPPSRKFLSKHYEIS